MKKTTTRIFGKIAFLTLSGLLFASTVNAQESLTVEQAIERALQNNLNVKKAGNDVLTSEVNLRQSKASILPSINGSNNNTLSFGRGLDQTTFQIVNQKLFQTSGNVSASIDVFGGFSKINQIKQNRILLDASKSAEEKAKNDLILQVVTSYMQIVYNEDLLRASREQLIVAQQTADREQALLDAGNKTLADISQAKAQVATAELNITNAQNDLTISYLNLAQLMEMQPENANFKVVAPTIQTIAAAETAYNINEVYKTALISFPDVKLAQFNLLAAKKQVDIAKGALYPSVNLQGGFGSSYSYRFNSLIDQATFADQISDRFNQFIGVGIQIPVFNGLNASSAVKRAKIALENSKLDEQLAKNNLLKVVSQAVADSRAAESRYSSTQKTFNAQSDAFSVIKERYGVGLVNSLDYNTAQTNRNKAEIDFIQAKYDMLFRAKVIDYYLGKQITF